MDKKVLTKTEEFISRIVSDIGFTECSINVAGEEQDDRFAIQIALEGEGLELLIGYHGKNLHSMHQVVLNFIRQNLDTDKRISLFLDIGGYFEKENEKVRELATQAIEEVKLLDEPYEFEPMSARLRREVHMVTSEDKDIRSESKGEGPSRRVVIYPANEENSKE